VGKGCILVCVILLSLLLVLGWRLVSQAAPTIRLQAQLKGIGQSTPVVFAVADPRHNLERVQVELRQGNRTFSVTDARLPTPSWWRFWSRASQRESVFTIRVGHKEFPELQEGRAALHFTATNDSWGRFFRGGQNELRLELPVRFVPPQVQVLSFPHYVNQGGSELVVFKVTPGTTQSGIQVGSYFFPSWPIKDSLPDTRLCLFALPYNVDTKTPARLVARDDAGNETVSDFAYRAFPKKFHTDTIQVTDDFLARVVPPILSQTPGVQDQGSLLKDFLLVNGSLRERNARELQALAKKTSPRFLWSQPFVQLGNSKVEAAFADHRTYLYNGQVIDHQDHLGFDLAVVEHNPVVAANDGVVIHAGYFGIYGNTIVIDHGCGLQSLYGHLSSIEVQPGESVKRGRVIARSGQTGLAGGDHLHFTMVLNGVPVNPVEWWDPHWIHDRIDAKLAAYR
jgi:murein DD-endopeptidase MepM/ murein hydrolase activator NlpD